MSLPIQEERSIYGIVTADEENRERDKGNAGMSKKARLGMADGINVMNGLFGKWLHGGADSVAKADFAVQHAEHALGEIRFSLWLSLFVYSIFAVVDIFTLPEKAVILLGIRFAGYLPLCLFTLFLSHTAFFRRHMQPLMFLLSFLGSIGLVAIYTLAAMEGSFAYRYALFFMVVFLYALLRLRFGWATLAGWLLFAFFNLAMFRFRPAIPGIWQGTGEALFFSLDQWNEEWINTALMLIFFNLFGMTMSWFREREEWHSFSLNRQLEKERTQVEEMNRELERRVQMRTLQFEDANTTLRAMNNKLGEAVREKEKTQEELRGSEEYVRKLFDGGTDAALIIEDGVIIDCNLAALRMMQLEDKSMLLGKTPSDVSAPYQSGGVLSEPEAERLIKLTEETGNQKFEWWHKRLDGSLFPVEVMLTAVRIQGRQLFHALLRDITERREMQQKLEYLSYHDQLTGLYNRRFFEEEVQRLDVPRNYPLSMLMADVNGLKLINDSFGHSMGDRILCAAANVMKAVCRSDDILARLSGDEFVMLLPGAGESEVEALVERMRGQVALERVGSLELSVSIGCATKRDEEMKAHELFSMAEDRMYHRKLTESPAMRGRTIRTILSTLHGRNEQEKFHAQRVSELCGSLGKAMDLNEVQVRELEMVGLLHDIGKIALHEDLLNKTEPLSTGEWEDFKRHAEIGYRMLSTVNELAEMAESVLAHHERWDGGGYPKGLSTEEIPLPARIIAIADSFDAITGKRVYQNTRTNAEAIDEMRQQSGKQFDPALLSLFLEKCV